MRVGKMRYRVMLQKPSDDVRIGSKTTFEDVKTVWASIRQTTVAEVNNAKQMKVIGQYEIRLWTPDDMDERWRIVHGQHYYDITSIDEPNHLIKETVVIAKRNKLKG